MTITDHASTGTPPTSETPAARAIDLVKIYGKGDAAVHALAGRRTSSSGAGSSRP